MGAIHIGLLRTRPRHQGPRDFILFEAMLNHVRYPLVMANMAMGNHVFQSDSYIILPGGDHHILVIFDRGPLETTLFDCS